MNLEETNRLLRFAAAIDNRKVDDATVIAWQAVLPDVDATDALEAARRHYRDSRDYLTPAVIAEGAAVIAEERRRERVRAQRQADEEHQRAIAPPAVYTENRSDEVKALITAVVTNLPQMDNLKRAQERARRERGRPVPQPPAKSRSDKPAKPIKYPPPMEDATAALATQYLIDGYHPDDVSKRLGISRRWCFRTQAKFTGSNA